MSNCLCSHSLFSLDLKVNTVSLNIVSTLNLFYKAMHWIGNSSVIYLLHASRNAFSSGDEAWYSYSKPLSLYIVEAPSSLASRWSTLTLWHNTSTVRKVSRSSWCTTNICKWLGWAESTYITVNVLVYI